MAATAGTLFWLVTAPTIGAVGFVLIWRLLRRRWLSDIDGPTSGVLAAVLVTAAWLMAFHCVAFGRLFGWLSGLSVPLVTTCFAALLALSCLLLNRWEGCSGPPAVVASARSRRGWLLWLFLLPVVVAHLLLLAEGLSRMPAGHDGLKYRLPMVVSWIKADALIMRPDVWLLSLPGNGELALWWLLKGGFERLASIAYFPLGILLASTAWSIVRIQRGSRFAAVLAVAILLSTHVVVYQMYHAYIDLFGTTFLACGIMALLLGMTGDRSVAARRLLFIVAGLAVGIALGTKPVNWLYALFTAIFFFCIHISRKRRNHDLAFLLPVFGLACLACSAFWFVRAAVETHNPFYPVRVAIGDRVLLEGVKMDAQYEIYDVREKPLSAVVGSPEDWHELVGRLVKYATTLNMLSGGVGPLFTTFVPLGMVVAVIMFIVRGQRARRHNRLVIGVLAVILFFLWIGPMYRYGRFGMIYMVVATCMAAPAIGWVTRHWPRAIGSTALVATFLACATLAAVPVKQLGIRLASGNLSRSAYYGLPSFIDQWPEGTRVANLSHWSGASSLTYPLYGQGLKNDVVDYMTTRMLFPDLKPTVEQLQDLKVEYVFVSKPFRGDWPTDPRLELIHDDSKSPSRGEGWLVSRVYRVPPKVPAEAGKVAIADNHR
jgi:hypothetical protein